MLFYVLVKRWIPVDGLRKGIMIEEKIRCTLCGCESIEKIDSTIRNADNSIYKMYRCSECETHFLYPLPEESQLENYYDGEFRSQVHTKNYYDKEKLDGTFNYFLPEARARLNRVVNELKPTDSVLEVGCSVGYFMSLIAPHVESVYGTEWDLKAGAYVKDRFPDFNIAKNPEDFGRSFDRIFLYHVLEHVEKPIEFLKCLGKMLNPGGVIYVEVPNADDALIKTYKCKAFMAHYYKLAHLYNFTNKSLSYVIEQAGFAGRVGFIQRYGLSNHMVWLRDGLPGGGGRFSNIINQEAELQYKLSLMKNGQADTLFVKLRRGDNE